MSKTRHINCKLNKGSLVNAIVNQCDSNNGLLDWQSLEKLIVLRRKVREIEEKGGVVLVKSREETLLTAYRFTSNH